ncbi:MAG: hypothetical protein ABWZ41_11720 [Burkholderiales bacterium]
MKLASFRGPHGLPRSGTVVDGRVIDLTDAVAALELPRDRVRIEIERVGALELGIG